MSDKGVCRTSPATQSLLTIFPTSWWGLLENITGLEQSCRARTEHIQVEKHCVKWVKSYHLFRAMNDGIKRPKDCYHQIIISFFFMRIFQNNRPNELFPKKKFSLNNIILTLNRGSLDKLHNEIGRFIKSMKLFILRIYQGNKGGHGQIWLYKMSP